MSAVTPTSVLEGTENPGWRRERGPSTEAGVPRLSQGIDRGEKATFGGDRRMGAGCTNVYTSPDGDDDALVDKLVLTPVLTPVLLD